MTGPRVLSVRTETMAGRMAITAAVECGCGEMLTERFQGASTPGYPGPVLYAFGDTWVRVADPQRFGDTFGADWVRAFYAWGGEQPAT